MSTVASQIDAREVLVGLIRRMGDTYVNDFGHLPKDQLEKSPGGVARSPMAFTAEVIGFNRLAARAARGEAFEVPSQEARQRFYDSINTYEKATAMLRETVAELADAVAAAPDEVLMRVVRAPWGAELSVYHLCLAAATHMSYHDGQINYLQTLLGDAENHWM